MAKSKEFSVVITAHGTINKTVPPITLSVNLITTCQLGETHHGKHLDFSNMSMFTNKSFLYDYILAGSVDYTNQGEVITKGTPIPPIHLSPINDGEHIQRWSWQKTQVTEHLRKMCIYELKAIPGIDINYLTMPTISNDHILGIARKAKNFKLLNHIDIFTNYENDSKTEKVVLDAGHSATLTTIKSSGICIFDYTRGPSGSLTEHLPADLWDIREAINSVSNFCHHHSVEMSGDVVLKACLE
jgi:hypothetical protein